MEAFGILLPNCKASFLVFRLPQPYLLWLVPPVHAKTATEQRICRNRFGCQGLYVRDSCPIFRRIVSLLFREVKGIRVVRLGKSFPCYNVDMAYMEKNLDLIRDIMLFVEAYYPHKNGGKDLRKITPDMFPEWVGREGFRDMLFDHVTLLFDEKLLYKMKTINRGEVINPTFAGYDFIEEIRDPKWFAKNQKSHRRQAVDNFLRSRNSQGIVGCFH